MDCVVLLRNCIWMRAQLGFTLAKWENIQGQLRKIQIHTDWPYCIRCRDRSNRSRSSIASHLGSSYNWATETRFVVHFLAGFFVGGFRNISFWKALADHFYRSTAAGLARLAIVAKDIYGEDRLASIVWLNYWFVHFRNHNRCAWR